jgi:hypothetical protein
VTEFDPAELLDICLQCVDREFPSVLDHAMDGPAEFTRPSDLHPTFFGSSDWHSSVHNHWLLVRIVRVFPDLDGVARARKILNEHLTPERLGRELDYFQEPNNGAFSRPYGWGWILRLHAEAAALGGSDGDRWEAALRPLRDDLAARMAEHFTTGLQFPIRSGLHGNTAFSLIAGIDTARQLGDDGLAGRLETAARRMFAGDRGNPTVLEPSGGDFLSPALAEAALMATVLSAGEFAEWLRAYLPGLDDGTEPVLRVPVYVRDASDPATVHLNGLLLIRAWSLSRIVTGLPPADERTARLVDSAHRHFTAAADVLTDRHYHAIHWLPTFALMTQTALRDAGIA